MKRDRCECRQQDVDRRTCERHPHHVDPRVVERAKIHRHRLGVAEQERRMRHQQKGRQQDRAERVDMFDWIETDAAEFPGGIVAEAASDEAMGSLMKRDCDDQGEDPDREVIEGDVERQSTLLRYDTRYDYHKSASTKHSQRAAFSQVRSCLGPCACCAHYCHPSVLRLVRQQDAL
jgi:hypothetical protein